MSTRALFSFSLLLVVALPAAAQMQPQARLEGRLLPIVSSSDGQYIVLDGEKKREAPFAALEVQPATAFGAGEVQVTNAQADLDPLKNASPQDRAKPASIRFRYTADVTAKGDLKECCAVLTFVVNGSVGMQLVPIGRLSAGRAKNVKVELTSRVDSVGRLHVFSNAAEIRSNQVPERYDVRAYFASLTQGARGVSAVQLCRSERQFPHALSNDGNRLATIRERDTHNALIVYDLAVMKLIRDVKLGDKGEDAWDLTWISDHELAYIVDDPAYLGTSHPRSSLMLLDVNTGKVERLMDEVNRVLTSVKSQPDILVIVRYQWGKTPWTGKFEVRTKQTLSYSHLESGVTFFDDNGDERIRSDFDDGTWKYFYKPTLKDDWRRLDRDVKQAGLKFDYRGKDILERLCEIHSIGPDGDTLYISTRLDSDRFELAAFSMSKGAIIKTVARHPKFDLSTGNGGSSRMLFRKGSSELIGISYDAEKQQVVWLDEGFAAVQKAMDKTFADHVNVPLDWSVDGNTFVFFSFSDRDPGTYYVFRPFESRLIPVLVQGDSLKDKPMARTAALDFAARDGAAIHAYVTSPPETSSAPAPLVVIIHGGPTARDSWTFDATNQFLATRGYVVLQVNYRGSSGFGTAYQKAGLYARLDTVVLDDVADGVRHLIKTGAVDPARVAVMGGSFGGWATYMSLIKYPELYRAGIAIAAISHWKDFLLNDRNRFHNDVSLSFWSALLDREDFQTVEPFIDPLLRVSELKQPIYIMHGEFDDVVHATEAGRMVDALKKTNTHVESLSFPLAGHSFWPFAARVTQLNEIEGFLRRNLAAPAAAAEK